MHLTAEQPSFTLDDINQTALTILEQEPDAIVTHRLLREVLRIPSDNPQLVAAKNSAQSTNWTRQLTDAQLPDGSWGRFHTQDTKLKTAFRTTEEAIDRAFALGLEPHDKVLEQARQYILDVLQGCAHVTDRTEKATSWPLLIQLILAGRLAQIEPSDTNLGLFWIYLEDVAEAAFASGEYRLDDEAIAHLEHAGIPVPQGFLESQHALWILSARQMPPELECKLVRWIWQKPDGMRYLRAPLADPVPRQIGYWLRSMNILARFPTWREVAMGTLNKVWQGRGEDGLWDFATGARMADFPLSENWRKANARKQDYSTCLLCLLRKVFD